MHIELSKSQANQITFQNLKDTLIVMKQYLNRNQINHYRFMLQEFGSLIELEKAQEDFDKAWPQDVKWYESNESN